jgi:hypothetical protein
MGKADGSAAAARALRKGFDRKRAELVLTQNRGPDCADEVRANYFTQTQPDLPREKSTLAFELAKYLALTPLIHSGQHADAIRSQDTAACGE